MRFNLFIAVALVIAALMLGHDHPLDWLFQLTHITTK